ncbi:MAG: protein kinase [Candidatus Eremiobacterota bacterium]
MQGSGTQGFLDSGSVLKSQFQIIKNLSVTELSRNYLGKDINTNKTVLVKELLDTFQDQAKKEQATKQFRIEAQILIGLVHRGIPTFRDYFEHDNKRYIVMDYIEGKTLHDHVKDIKDFFDEKQLLTWALELCDILHYLHSRRPNPVIFRALAPKNIIISPEGKLILINFAISKVFSPSSKTMAVAKMVNHNFSPLEQYSGVTDKRTDIYSLGATLYYTITKELPVDAMNRSLEDTPLRSCMEINNKISPELEAIIIKCMELQQDMRYQNVSDIQADLRKLFDMKYRLQSAPKTSRLSLSSIGGSSTSPPSGSLRPPLNIPADSPVKPGLSQGSLKSTVPGGMVQGSLKPSLPTSSIPLSSSRPSLPVSSIPQSSLKPSLPTSSIPLSSSRPPLQGADMSQSSPRSPFHGGQTKPVMSPGTPQVVAGRHEQTPSKLPARPPLTMSAKTSRLSDVILSLQKPGKTQEITDRAPTSPPPSRVTYSEREEHENKLFNKQGTDIAEDKSLDTDDNRPLPPPVFSRTSSPPDSQHRKSILQTKSEESKPSSWVTSDKGRTPLTRRLTLPPTQGKAVETLPHPVTHGKGSLPSRAGSLNSLKGQTSDEQKDNKPHDGTGSRFPLPSFPKRSADTATKVVDISNKPLPPPGLKSQDRPEPGNYPLPGSQSGSLKRIQTRKFSTDSMPSLPARKEKAEKEQLPPYGRSFAGREASGSIQDGRDKKSPAISHSVPAHHETNKIPYQPEKGEDSKEETAFEKETSLPSREHPVDTGVILNNRYKVIELLGEGQTTRTYKAMDMKNNCHVALKELLDKFDDPVKRREAILQFQVEAKILIKLEHPAIPKFEEYFSHESRRFFIIDFVEGETLDRIIQNSPFFEEYRLIEWAIELCDIIDYMHSQTPEPVIFRDMCPKNVILSSEGKLKIIDFGISKLFTPDAKTAAVAKTINPNYSPVEQYVGQTDQKSDIYSVGATLYYLATKSVPVDAIDRSINDMNLPNCRRFNNNISTEFEAIILKAMEINKVDRYENIKEMKVTLQELYKKIMKASPLPAGRQKSGKQTGSLTSGKPSGKLPGKPSGKLDTGSIAYQKDESKEDKKTGNITSILLIAAVISFLLLIAIGATIYFTKAWLYIPDIITYITGFFKK